MRLFKRTLFFGFVTATAASALLLVGCKEKASPTEPTSCASVAGTYSGTGSAACVGNDIGDDGGWAGIVVIAQNGCTVSATFPGIGTLSGVASGNQFSYTLTLASPLCGSATGTAYLLPSGVINSGYRFPASSTGCCNAASGNFSLTPR